jgi:hypothetical protein
MRHKAGRSLEAKPPKRGNESDQTERALRILEGARGSYRRILVTEGIRRQRLELAI